MFPLREDTNGYKTVVGRQLAKRLKGIPVDFRALLAAELMAGEVVLHGLTQTQASALVRVNRGYVSCANKASPEQREDIKHKRLSIRSLYRKRRDLTDDRLEKLILAAGPGRVMQILDRLTAPTAIAAE
jgi:hypothetical protein